MIPIGIYRGERTKKNSRPYVYLKPPPDTILNPKDKVYVLSPKQPKELDYLDSDDEDREKVDGNNILNKYNLRTKLVAEDGKIDLEIARQLLKVTKEIDSVNKASKNINEKFFSKGLTTPEFISQVRSVITEELGKGANYT